MPTWPSSGGWPASGNWPSSGGWPASGNWPSSGTGFSGNFVDLFPGAYQIAQSNLGLTYGGTMLATGTTPPVITLTGTLTGNPVPIQVTCTGGGALGVWFGQISYDGGSTVAQVFTSSSTVALTGAGTGLTLNIAAGTASANNVWKATCAALADQSGNGLHYTQATASRQPTVNLGLNGRCSIAGNGTNMFMDSAFNAPSPGTTAYYTFAVFRQVSFIAITALAGCGPTGNNANILYANTSGTLLANNGTAVINSGLINGSWQDVERVASNKASDTFKVGVTTVTANAGNLGCTGSRIFANGGGAFGNFELLLLVYTPNLPDWAAARAAVNSAAGYGVGAVLL